MATETLPLFPLTTVLFPGGLLPLQVFEVRYLDMVNQCHRAGTPFGVVSLISGSEVRRREGAGGTGSDNIGKAGFVGETFQDVGTLADISDFVATRPGLVRVTCKGGQRFKILRREQLPWGLWMAEVERLNADIIVQVPPDLQGVADALGDVVRALKQQGVSREQMPFAPPYALDECAWVANRWCELLPMTPAHKHLLMALDNPLVRLELVRDFLEQQAERGT